MYCVRKVTNDLYWVGANDHRLALFENCFPIPRGVTYNAYCLLDEKTVLFDTVDWFACRQLLENLAYVLDGRELDYLLVNHLEPDHAACIEEILLRHPKVKLISNEKAFMLMRQFGFHVDGHECIEVKEGDTFSFGKHTVTFVGAPMVHWPEAMVTLDVTDGVLFSADAFGTFGALDGKLFADEVDFERDWLDDARRYLTNIVGKYGPHIQLLLKRPAAFWIRSSTSARSTAPCGARIWAGSSKSTTHGAAMPLRPRACSSSTPLCTATRRTRRRRWRRRSAIRA